jgi:hypothetical protein
MVTQIEATLAAGAGTSGARSEPVRQGLLHVVKNRISERRLDP